MKFIHLSDLHIGKRLNEYSLIEDQRYILGEIVKIIEEKKPDCVFIAGDVYDKSMPSAEAVSLLDEFLESLSQCDTKVFVISGNHDSAERIAYGNKLFAKHEIYISPVFDGKVAKHEVYDDEGKVNIYLLPFLRPSHVRRFFEEEIESYTKAIDVVIKSLDVNCEERNVILAHQYVAGAARCDSEEETIGGLDMVEAYVFDDFDYTALGHIHTCQKTGSETIMYSGTPLKYSASEAFDKKCVIFGELGKKGDLKIEKINLVPLRDYVVIEGMLEDILRSENKRDYVKVVLTDEETVVDAYGKLKENYPYMTELVFLQNTRRREADERGASLDKSHEEQFFDFYELINGKDMKEEQKEAVMKIFALLEEKKQ